MNELEQLAATQRASGYARRGIAPTYGAIKIGASIMRIIGGVYLIGGAALIAIHGLEWLKADKAIARASAEVLEARTGLMYGLAAFAAGIIVLMLAELALAIRDMARNSFR